jgi:hypothetical protein
MNVLAAIGKSAKSFLIELAHEHCCCRFCSSWVLFRKMMTEGTVCSSIAGVLRKEGADGRVHLCIYI